jgi:hypothetical protein
MPASMILPGCHLGKGHAHRDTVLRFLKADIEATALMQRDRQVFNAALAKWLNIMDHRSYSRTGSVPCSGGRSVTLPFSCPFDAPASRKRQQAPAQSEGLKSTASTGDGARSGNVQHTGAKGG